MRRTQWLATTLTLAACTQVPKAPEGSPRIEVEVAPTMEERFLEPLAIEDLDELQAEFDELVLEQADVGMRFYPLGSDAYENDNQRPSYLLTVTASNLDVEYKYKDKKVGEGEEPRVETLLSALRCDVVATLERRRQGRPALPVGRSKQSVHWRVKAPEEGVDTYPLSRPGVEGEDGERPILEVARADVMLGVDRAVRAALKDLVRPIDREFELSQRSAQATQAAQED